MHDTSKIEALAQSLMDYIEARQEQTTARDKYEGYEWGYYGHPYFESVETAAEKFQKQLDKYIADAINKDR